MDRSLLGCGCVCIWRYPALKDQERRPQMDRPLPGCMCMVKDHRWQNLPFYRPFCRVHAPFATILLFVVITHQTNLKKSSLGLTIPETPESSMVAAGTGSWETTWEPQAWNTESKLEVGGDSMISKPCPMTYFLQEGHTLPKQCRQWGSSVKIVSLWGTFLTKTTSTIKLI